MTPPAGGAAGRTDGTTEGTPETTVEAPVIRRRFRPPTSPVVRAVSLYVVMGLGLGALAGVVWWQVVDLAAYTVAADGRATTDERGLTRFFAGDAWFSLIGVVVGVALGVFAWRRFRDLGWPLPVIVVSTALAAALICWLVGYQLGPGDFTHRIAAARPGDQVPIALTLRAPVSLLVWPFLAIIPVLLGASLGRDDEEPRITSRSGARRTPRLARRDRRRQAAETSAPSTGERLPG